MTLAPWRSPLARALHLNRSKPYSRYFQLATIGEDGKPANRTVVFRGFLEDTNQLKIITDSRSQKISQINSNFWGEICWYFTETREQFRLSGKLILVGISEVNPALQTARNLTWQELSDPARLQFAWPHSGKPRANLEAFSPPAPDPINPPDNFCLLLLNPVKVDHLELRGEPQNRQLYLLNESQIWTIEKINP